jgi:hypothetical protein
MNGGARGSMMRSVPLCLLAVLLSWLCAAAPVAAREVVLVLQLKAPPEALKLVVDSRAAELTRCILEERVRAAGGKVGRDAGRVDRLLMRIPDGSTEPWPWWQEQATRRGIFAFKEPNPKTEADKDESWVTLLAGDVVARTQVVAEKGTDRFLVLFDLIPEAARRLEEITTRLVGKPLAICLDDRVLSILRVKEPVTDGKAQIEVGTSREEADRICDLLQARPLPVAVSIAARR